MKQLKKFWRYVRIYGFFRALNKAAGRLRNIGFISPKFIYRKPAIGLVGCGQFQFSTIAFFLSRAWVNPFLFSYDIDPAKADSLAGFYNIPHVLTSSEDLFSFEKLNLVYIASNHASHTSYAINFLMRGVNVYCEKPISVNFQQFEELLSAIESAEGNFYAGYNRPYSAAIMYLKDVINSKSIYNGKITLNCFISVHLISQDHWYRNPEEGTRICGNVGHWLDLMIHIYNWKGFIPKKYKVQIAYSNLNEPDDNITISITTPEGDITSITISARTEPFEGINETINFQFDTVIAKIDDFRKMTVWDEAKFTKKRYRPKDVGHKRSVMQPFREVNRDLNEVVASTELMLHITEMVRNIETEKEILLTCSL